MFDKIELTNGSVLLRPYRRSDTDLLHEAVRESVTEISPWMPWCHADYSAAEAGEWVKSRAEVWEKGTEYDFTIIDTLDGSFLGGCGLNHVNQFAQSPGIANLGYWVRTGKTKRGVATTATKLLAEFGFKELHLQRIELVIAIANKASQRVAEKAGATREGILSNRLLLDGKISDAVLFSLIPQDVTG
ncbi:GNAT family N-acetyltransferase [Chloroflexota bacterium]